MFAVLPFIAWWLVLDHEAVLLNDPLNLVPFCAVRSLLLSLMAPPATERCSSSSTRKSSEAGRQPGAPVRIPAITRLSCLEAWMLHFSLASVAVSTSDPIECVFRLPQFSSLMLCACHCPSPRLLLVDSRSCHPSPRRRPTLAPWAASRQRWSLTCVFVSYHLFVFAWYCNSLFSLRIRCIRRALNSLL